jgi:hypothetical protein
VSRDGLLDDNSQLAGGTIMFTEVKIFLSAAVFAAAASAASAKDGGLPKIDLEKACRASEKEIKAVFSGIDRDVFAACMRDEQTAREQLVKDWGTYSTSDRGRCVLPTDYLPSYVEWVTCIEMRRDVGRIRSAQAASTFAASSVLRKPLGGRTGPETKTCPVVQWREDGSVVSVDAC